MKKIFILPMLISFTMICSCQKQDSAVEQQLAQRKAELDARENALDERLNALDEKVNALDERVNALAEKEKVTPNDRTAPADVQSRTPDPAQVQAERERLQQLATQMRSLIPDHSKMKVERDRQRQLELEKLQSQNPRKSAISGGAVFPAPEATSPTLSPAVEAASQTPSAELQATSPTASPTPQ
jgi:DNA repair exonuclease SbcCD ATPase subunit